MFSTHVSLKTIVLSLILILGAGCDRKTGPASPLESKKPNELAPAQSTVFGTKLSELPDEGLVDQSGEPFSFDDLSGKPTIISTIYTSCPMPKMCPLLTSNLGKVQQKLREELDAPADAYRFVLVSFDPENDTPKMMRDYVTERGWSLDNAVLVTGDPETTDALMTKLGIATKREKDDTITHNMRTYLAGSDGTIQYGFRKSGWNPDDVVARFRTLVP